MFGKPASIASAVDYNAVRSRASELIFVPIADFRRYDV
jgi:hypothetical protein